MTLHRRTWLQSGVAIVVLALLNLHCWRPGLGGRTDGVGQERPDGSEVELYYGWPACYRAELLRSGDPGLSGRLLRSAPFFLPPYGEARVVARHLSWPAAALDLSFAVLAVIGVTLYSEWERRGRWPRIAIAATVAIPLLLMVAYWTAPAVSTHL